ncbi:MAG: hypothetical protein ACAI44_32760, partial [Candidatus Sericytochromatia bacterium]
AELLIEKKGADGSKTYDVYALAVEGKEGKSLKSVDLFENVKLEKDLAKKYGGDLAIIAPENEKRAQEDVDSLPPKEDFITYWNVRPDLGRGWEGIKYSAMATAFNVMSFATGGHGVGPWALGQIYMNEGFKYEAESAAKAKAPAASPAAHGPVDAPKPAPAPRKTE